MSQTEKLGSSFRWLNVTQFFGAFNDNIFQLLCLFSILVVVGEDSASEVTSFVGFAFVAPFILFTPIGGILADRMSKATIIRLTKYLELFVMILGGLAFWYQEPLFVYLVLGVMSFQSALFGPSKYGSIPELVPESHLSKANGVIDAFTYLAIIFGTALAPLLSSWTGRNYSLAVSVCIIIALIGIVTSHRIQSPKVIHSQKPITPSFLLEPFRVLWSVRKDSNLVLAIIASAYFNFVGAFTKFNIIPYGFEFLHFTQEQSIWLFMLGALGIALGALAAGYISGRFIEWGIVPIGVAIITIAAVWLGFGITNWLVALCPVFLFGLGAGLFVIPLSAFIQHEAPQERRGEIIATSAFFSWIGVLLAAAALYVFSSVLDMDPAQGFMTVGILTFFLLLATFIVLPDFLFKFLLMIITRLIYRMTVTGKENIPLKGGALLIPNHVAYIDAVLLAATQQRRIRFIMWDKIYHGNRVAQWIYDLMGVIPIGPGGEPEEVGASLKSARKALDEGYLVCIFAEGKLTRDGKMGPFKSGFERILQGTDHPIVPVYLGGVWGSLFSFSQGALNWKKPLRVPYPVNIFLGKQMPSTSSADEVKSAVERLEQVYEESQTTND